MAEREELLQLAADIVSTHASNSALPADQLPKLIQQVYSALATAHTNLPHRRTCLRRRPDLHWQRGSVWVARAGQEGRWPVERHDEMKLGPGTYHGSRREIATG